MKPIIANRTFQWFLILLLGLGVTVTISFLAAPATQKTNTLTSAEAPAGDSLHSEIPKTPEKKTAPALSDRIAEYHIAVSLHPDKHILQGAQTITWKNPGQKPVGELYFHLYPNAFASKKTTFMRESGGKLRGDKQRKDSYGSMSIQSIQSDRNGDLLQQASFVQPDDGNADDQTLMKLSLPQPVAPGEKVTLSMDFTVDLPVVFARMGYADDFYMAGQWFPKLAAYETAGTRGRSEEGWNLHQYHGNSEFYADFGIYDVKINVPPDYIVAATGFPPKPAAVENGVKTYRFYAEDVHDFAWAASPHFIYAEEPYSSPYIAGVKIKLYLDPKHEQYKNRYLLAAKKALTRFSEWYGPYPYSTLSIVVPPQSGNGAGGMEYPTLVTAWGASDAKPDLELERVVVHEIGHQFWYGMVASNEFEEAWLDEGFTSYAEDKVMEKEYGVKPNLPFEGSYITSPEPLKQNAWNYKGHDSYAENVYTRAKLALFTMEKNVGPETMGRIMKTYFQRWQFHHPSTQDFQAVAEDVTQKNWKPFFDQYVYGGNMIDYSAESVRIKNKTVKGQRTYENEIVIRRLGAQHDAVPIRFRFTDGTVVDKTWDSQGSEIVYQLTHSSPLDWVLIDPEFTLLLENRHINNFLKAEVDKRLEVRWNLGIAKLLETLFSWVGW